MHQPSSRLVRLTGGRLHNYVHGVDGYWADRVLDAFAPVEELGLRLDSLNIHHSGDSMRYTGEPGDVELYLRPDEDDATSHARLHGFEGSLTRLARQVGHPPAATGTLGEDVVRGLTTQVIDECARMWGESLTRFLLLAR